MSADPPPANWFAGLAVLLGLSTFFCGSGPIGPAVLSGLAGVWYARRTGKNRWPALLGISVAAACAVISIVARPIWAEYKAEQADRARQSTPVRWIALSLINDEAKRKAFPSACYWRGPDPPPDPARAWSWRFKVLPYMEQETVYRGIKLDEPWDSPSNHFMTGTMRIYADDGAPNDPFTRYRVIYGNGSLFELHRMVKSNEITDGAANTILFVQAGETVPWPQCNELPFDPAGPLPPLGRPDRNYFLAAMADGSVKVVRKDADPNVIRAAITRAGGEPSPDW